MRRNGNEIVLPTEEINIGDVVIVRPGEKIPMDGKLEGNSRRFLCGSVSNHRGINPCRKKFGDEVFAATINQGGSLEVKVSEEGNQITTLARIIHSVEESQAKRSSYQRFRGKIPGNTIPLDVYLRQWSRNHPSPVLWR